MKKILQTLIVICGLCISASAQTQSSVQTNTSATSKIFNEKMVAIQSCEELNLQLTKLFGSEYTISMPKVKAQLEKNILDKSVSHDIRKISLYCIYGDSYINKLHLINDENTIPNQQK